MAKPTTTYSTTLSTTDTLTTEAGFTLITEAGDTLVVANSTLDKKTTTYTDI